MTDAPETIWARPDPYEPDWTGDKMLRSKDHVEYRRADIVLPMPPTPAQLMADPRVRAMVEAGNNLINDVLSRYPNEELRCPHMVAVAAALAQLKEPKP